MQRIRVLPYKHDIDIHIRWITAQANDQLLSRHMVSTYEIRYDIKERVRSCLVYILNSA